MPQGTTQPRNNDNARVAAEPKPQIGTGGNDFFQFTQARAAIGADPEFKSADIVIDVKAGVLTLSGSVASAAQKSRAEQLVRAVDGVKGVNNRLRISK
jgi:hyperosmotically inducible protein